MEEGISSKSKRIEDAVLLSFRMEEGARSQGMWSSFQKLEKARK